MYNVFFGFREAFSKFARCGKSSCGDVLIIPTLINADFCMVDSYIPIVVTIIIGLIFGYVMLKLHEILGPKRPSREKETTYESGMEPIASARERYSVKFYLVAMLFILFDIEIVFMYPWAVSFNTLETQGFIAMILFMVLLFAGFIYVVKKGALKWE